MTDTHATPATYLWIWVWLAALMLVSVFLSEANILPVAKGAVVLLVLGLSTVKALLVALYYMHLKFERFVLAFVAAFPLMLIVLATLLVLSSRLVKL